MEKLDNIATLERYYIILGLLLRNACRTEHKPLTLPIRRQRLARHGGVRQVHILRIPKKGWFIHDFILTPTMNHTQESLRFA